MSREKTRLFCPGTSDLNGTGKGLKQDSPSWEANQFSASQETPHNLWNPKVDYHIYNSLPPVPVSQINLVHTQPIHVIYWFQKYKKVNLTFCLKKWTRLRSSKFLWQVKF